ncbi:MAG: response regulator [Granulosicoccus sp.]
MTTEPARTHTVFIVDDSKEDRYLLKRFLKKTDLPLVVLEACNGQEAIDLLLQPIEQLQQAHPGINQPVTLFLDINMPVMNGWEFLAELERLHDEITLKRTIIVMYSTSDAEYEKEKAEQFPAIVNYIVKGETTPESLRKTIMMYESGS